MLDIFRSDFWALAKNRRGYYSWAERQPWQLGRAIRGRHGHRCPCCDEPDAERLVESLFADGPGIHPLLDVLFDAFARAESRFSLRFVPQRSHEERLTGNLVSEIEAALHLARPRFRELSKHRYGAALDVDFLYYDLSQGGIIEKESGGDLALILSVTLPDFPELVRYAAFQAKKFDSACSLPKKQYETLTATFGDAASYLFYDTKVPTLLPPMVLAASRFESKADEKSATNSFTVSSSDVDGGIPLSLWLVTSLAKGKAGSQAPSFDSALSQFTDLNSNTRLRSGRLAVITVGRALRVSANLERGLDVSLDA